MKKLLLFFMSSLISAPVFGKSGEVICTETESKKTIVFPLDRDISWENPAGKDYYELRIEDEIYQCDEVELKFEDFSVNQK